MARRTCLALASILLLLLLSAVALAATRPLAHTDFLFVSPSRFGVTLDTKASGVLQVGSPAPPNAPAVYAHSGIIVVCPTGADGAISELNVGFPGAKLKLSKGHYRFKLTYTWKQPHIHVIVGPGAGSYTAAAPGRVAISGTVTSAKLITGTIAVHEPGCELPRSSFRAARFRSIPN